MRLLIVSALYLAVPLAAAADSDRGACARLNALLEVADLTEGFEDVPAIARSGDDAACAKALLRFGISTPPASAGSGQKAPGQTPEHKDSGCHTKDRG
jgi:hypothetical protein